MDKHFRRLASLGAAWLCCFAIALFALPAVARTDRWTAIGPDGANVVVLAVDPRAPSTVIAGTTGSGALKSVDGGASWATVNGGLPTANVSALAIDPSTSSTLFAGTDAGVFKSTDGGQNWAVANGGLVGAAQINVNALAIVAGSPATLYAATSAGVFKTIDAAANWTSINAGLSGLTPRVIAIDAASPATIYVGVDDNVNYTGNGIFKSTDAGISWTRIYTTDFAEDYQYSVAAIAIDPRSSSRLFAAIAYGDVLRSVDGGASWSSLEGMPLTALHAGISALAIDPASSTTLYAGTYSGAVFRTTDGGDHWTAIPDSSLPAASINVITIAASTTATVYVGGRTGVFQSVDGGATWTHPALGIRNVSVYTLAVDPVAPSSIYAGVGGIVTRTTDGGGHWADSAVGPWVNLLVIDPASPSTLYAGVGAKPALYKSVDGGVHWAPSSDGLSVFGIQAMAIAPSSSSTLYVGAAFAGVSKSTDGGASWKRVNNGLTAVGIYVSALAVDPTSADIVYVATPPTGRPDTDAKVFKSTNGADQWRQVPIAIPTGAVITSLVIDPGTPSTIYAGYVDYPTGLGGIFKSSDSGETWAAPPNLLYTGCCLQLAIDPSTPSRIYAATQSGVVRSVDAATSWTPLNSGLPSLDVWSISISRTGSLLRAATPAGLFEFQDSGLSPSTNYQGLWWAAPAGSESGWGINFSHAGDQVFATWYTYDTAGKAWWLSLLAKQTTPTANVYKGRINVESGPSFDNFVGTGTATEIGDGTLNFIDANHGTFDYDLGAGTGGSPVRVAQTRTIERFDLGGPQPICVYDPMAVMPVARNFQDLWWAASGSESGWGINFAHQGSRIFATWFTYDIDGSPLWLSALMQRDGYMDVYKGNLLRSTGPRFDNYRATDLQPSQEVGQVTLTFADGNRAKFDYTVQLTGMSTPASQSKQIVRYPLAASGGTICY